MSGLFLLFLALVWLAFLLLLAYKLTLRIVNPTLRAVTGLLLIGVLLPLPLVDEFMGKRQFEQLCRDNATIQVERAMAVGKTVYFDQQPDVEINNGWIRIVQRPVRYVDSTTGEVVISFSTLTAVGGRLVQLLGTSEGRVPLTFVGSCGPKEDLRALLKSLGTTPEDRRK